MSGAHKTLLSLSSLIVIACLITISMMFSCEDKDREAHAKQEQDKQQTFRTCIESGQPALECRAAVLGVSR